MLKVFREKKRPQARLLREYARCAHNTYDCCHCNCLISPGERYEAHVMVCGPNLWVTRWHEWCPFDPNDEEERKALQDDDFMINNTSTADHWTSQKAA